MASPPPCTRPSPEVTAVRQWYEGELGWATSGGDPLELLTGLRFDVLEMPAVAGRALLRRGLRTGPVALDGDRLRLLVAAGSAEELPGLLDWLEWGGVALDLTAVGSGGRMAAPMPPAGGTGRGGSREAADGSRTQPVWLRPPEPGCEVEPTLPAASLRCGLRGGRPAAGGRESQERGAEGAPDLVRLVGAAATECHRARLLRAADQALAFSYASRTVAGTRPRSLTS